ncbi:tyrosine-type recombinase/integrase [Clostridium estertheticum]|uniref:tyrosine-type recombinase/integrase n=1 Tax=Clostridium estertheticum TaxID=238834 RepID=UPI001C0BC1DB|nr:tyrosine-type recombinase/integrase [Clostridium estertheticum]MBU3176660.1 tyrosine-type recombinase/integrase [Clostridium estertheticum]
MRKKIDMKKKIGCKTFDEGYDEFILNCKVRNLRPTTIKHYDDIVNHIWYKFIDYKTPISGINHQTIQRFVLFCKERMNENDTTINTNLIAMRAIMYYYMRLGYTEEFKVSLIKADRAITETYSEDEIKILLKRPNLDKCNFVECRNWVIVKFLLATGCRIRTLVNIKIKDVDFANQLISYTHTKNRKAQIVPMSNSIKKVLIEYLNYRGADSEDDLMFVNAYGTPLKTDLLSHNLCTYNRRRGIMKTGVHRWRHTFAKMWILKGGDVFKLQRMLGHSSMDVVKNYVNMFTNDLQEDFNEFNPLEQIIESNRYVKMR